MERRELTERERAQIGLRRDKEPGSSEWCWQTVYQLKDRMRHVDEQWRQAEQVMDDLKKARAWRVIPSDHPYGTFDRMLREELGLDEQAIKEQILQARLAAHGGDRRSADFQANNVSLKKQHGNSDVYTLRRLRRDRPDLAKRVEDDDDKMTAHKAAIEAGFRPRTFTVPITTPKSIAATLRRQLKDPEVIAAVIAELSDPDTNVPTNSKE